METVVLKFEPRVLPPNVITCPRCHGMRHLCDSTLTVTATEVRSTPATPCFTCCGSGLVKIEPYEEK